MRQTQSEIDEMFKDQQRVRENLSSLNRVAGQQEQVQRYARELAEQESRLASLRDRMAELRKRKAALETELNDLLEKAEF
jgi:predicted  nucleic acid-binding Zn-ribbon protein